MPGVRRAARPQESLGGRAVTMATKPIPTTITTTAIILHLSRTESCVVDVVVALVDVRPGAYVQPKRRDESRPDGPVTR